MAGHTSEKRWRRNQNSVFGNVGVSELARDICTQMISALTTAEAAFAELQELFGFVGSTVQGLADQLFFEDWSVRFVLGTQAEVSVDIVANVLDSVSIDVAGTDYTDGVGFLLPVSASGGSGGVVTYDVVAGAFTNAAIASAGSGYVDNTGVTINVPTSNKVFETQANAAELSKAQDLFDGITALHELHQAANNIAVSQEDRYAQIRRLS